MKERKNKSRAPKNVGSKSNNQSPNRTNSRAKDQSIPGNPFDHESLSFEDMFVTDDYDYGNATLLCRVMGKSFEQYYDREATKQFMDVLSRLTRIPKKSLIKEKPSPDGSSTEIWLHFAMIIDLAQWCSPWIAATNCYRIVEMLRFAKSQNSGVFKN